jgi:hypothetical protein
MRRVTGPAGPSMLTVLATKGCGELEKRGRAHIFPLRVGSSHVCFQARQEGSLTRSGTPPATSQAEAEDSHSAVKRALSKGKGRVPYGMSVEIPPTPSPSVSTAAPSTSHRDPLAASAAGSEMLLNSNVSDMDDPLMHSNTVQRNAVVL